MAGLEAAEEDLHVILNMSDHAVDAPLPAMPGRRWHLALDTSEASPADILARAQQKPHAETFYPVNARSVVVLEAR
jgi:glycogen operon protein